MSRKFSHLSAGFILRLMCFEPDRYAVHEEDLKAAFDFFDINKRGVITAADLKSRCNRICHSVSTEYVILFQLSFHISLPSRLGVFYKNLPAREYKFLISEPDFTYQSLHKLLVNNELRDFDPVKEVCGRAPNALGRDVLHVRSMDTEIHRRHASRLSRSTTPMRRATST